MIGEAPSLPLPLAGVAFVFGVIVGSFLNVLIHRLPRGESIVHPSSRCPKCQRPLAPWENVPLFSYLILRGRCRSCGARISLRYPAIEGLTGLLFVAIALRYGAVPMLPVWMAFAAALLTAAMIDLDHRIIPDEISLGGLAVGLLVVPLLGWLSGGSLLTEWGRAASGALLGGGSLWLVGFGHARVATALGRTYEHWPGEGETIPRPHELDYWIWFPGMGLGDIKLLAMIGAFLGPLGVCMTILIASLAGLLLGFFWSVLTRSWNTPFGFGPAIALGALLVVLAPRGLLPFL
jgi:leader peptidase (prepilin peptidase)/N-methyltransferase